MSKLNKSTRTEEFLPAALEILETPPSPLGRVLVFVVLGMFSAVGLWAYLGKVDVIVAGQGRLVPVGQIKTVQAFEAGVVTGIHVQEGQFVEAGHVLIELDPTETTVAIERLEQQLEDRRLDLALAQSVIGETSSPLLELEGVSADKAASAVIQMQSLLQAHRAALDDLAAQRDQFQSQLEGLQIEAEKIDSSIPLMEERLAAGGSLLSRDALRHDDRLSLEQSLVEFRAARQSLDQQRFQLRAAIEANLAQERQVVANFRATHNAAGRDASAAIQELEGQIVSERRRNLYRSIVAPINGYVDQLAVYTVGGVVNAGEPVLNIVPSDADLEVEVFILNKDVGFVGVDDIAELKLEAFPFTRYGVLDAVVTGRSNDAVAHEQMGLVYKVRAAVTTPLEQIQQAGIVLEPGMNVTLEILTEERRIIEYFISPLLRYRDEAIRER